MISFLTFQTSKLRFCVFVSPSDVRLPTTQEYSSPAHLCRCHGAVVLFDSVDEVDVDEVDEGSGGGGDAAGPAVDDNDDNDDEVSFVRRVLARNAGPDNSSDDDDEDNDDDDQY